MWFLASVLLLGAGVVPSTALATSAQPAQSASKSFSDVPPSHWAHSAVTWMANNRILDGMGDGRFCPDDAVTREQFAKIMVVALQLKVHSGYAPSFSDVPTGAWSFRYVEAAKPYLTGWRVGANQLDLFKPGEAAVREDMAVALVKALQLSAETPDLSVLDAFADRQTISVNLQRHVALAVANGIMNGILRPDGSKAFDAQGVLTRAQAAVLVFNALVRAGEKVTYDDDPAKVVYSDPATAPSGYVQVVVSAKVSGDSVVASWTRVDDLRLNGYKVVLSATNPAPVYPADGYYAWITDPKTTSMTLRAGKPYNGGDVGGTLKAGVKYYLSITAVYDGHAVKAPGNAVEVTLPATAQQSPLPVVTVKSKVEADGLQLLWTKVVDPRFSGYKVVLSRNEPSPTYPEHGYLKYITDPCQTSLLLKPGAGYSGNNDFGGRLEAGVTYYARITALYSGGAKTHSNVIRVTIP